MRVVYDTSVLATILSRRDLILQLQAAIADGGVTPVTSPYIISELERVLSDKFGLTKQGAKSRARLLARVAEVVQPQDVAQVARDAKDDPILAAAVTGQAEYIVTFDADLLVLKHYNSVSIITLDEFREILAKQGQ